MKLLQDFPLVLSLLGIDTPYDGGIPWVERPYLEQQLAGSDHAEIASEVLKSSGSYICVAGSYSVDLPSGYQRTQDQLTDFGLLPVTEGRGLIFSVDHEFGLKELSNLSVWRDEVVLNTPGGQYCVKATEAVVDLRREAQSIVITVRAKQ